MDNFLLFFFKNQIQIPDQSQKRFAALRSDCDILLSRATKERKSALYVAHWATEINLMFCLKGLWVAHLLFVFMAHPGVPYFERSLITRNR